MNHVLLRHALSALFCCLLATVVSGCKEEKSATQAAGKMQIAVIPKGTTHEHWVGVHAGADAAGKEFNVDILWKGPLKEDDRAGQKQIVEQFVADGVSGIVLAPLDDLSLLPPVRQAVAHKIPVVIFDSGLAGEQGKDFVSLVATDNKNAGYLGGKELGRLLGGKGKVVLLRYQQNSASTELREAGFLDAIKESPEIKIISENQYAGATADSAQKRAEQMLDTLREADGVFCSNESATQGMLNALERASMLGADQKLKFVGFDKSGPLLKALGEGKIHALVAQNPEKMGYEAVKAMVQHLNGKPVPAVIDTGAIVITRQNLGSAEVKKLLNR